MPSVVSAGHEKKNIEQSMVPINTLTIKCHLLVSAEARTPVDDYLLIAFHYLCLL